MWRYGQSLRPYFKDVVSIVRHREEIIEFDGCEVVESESLSFEHCPIIDCGVTDDGVVVRLAMKLVTAISEGEVLYIHCWGGHGRTGTIVCIMLHLMYGVSDFKKNK
jgi:protein tyrosine phosphatase